ncbi:MAG: acyl-CoA synthetase [Burkholderiales bacterium]
MQRHVDGGIDGRMGPEWVARPERGNALVTRMGARLALLLGRPAAHLLLFPVCLYFLAFSPKGRAASRKFLRKALGREPRPADVFRHFRTFAATILDRVYLLNGQYSRLEVCVHGEDVVRDIASHGEGCFLLGAHLGSFEILRFLGEETHHLRVSLVMYEENARKLNSVFHAINPGRSMPVIALGNVESMLKVEEALARGEVVGMLGDRTIEGQGTVSCSFFGEQARFPVGPLRVAAMLRRPVILMFGLYRGGNRYDVYFERLADMRHAERARRDLVLEQSLQCYVGRIEHHCRLAPYNWFNFYDFWK